MTGSPSAPGFLPRSLETIFASIDGQQTKQFQVQAAEANSFQLLDEAEYMDERVEKRHEVSRIQMYRGIISFEVELHWTFYPDFWKNSGCSETFLLKFFGRNQVPPKEILKKVKNGSTVSAG